MITSEQNMELTFKGFKTLFGDAFGSAPVDWPKVAMQVQSGTRSETYGWLGQFPQLREWLGGERAVKSLEAHSFTIVNRKFESTVGISRDDFADDRLGIFAPVFSEMGHRARQHPEELIFDMLGLGFTALCYDGQNFFDTDHPTLDADGALALASNVQAGTDPAWYLMDTSRAIKPIVWQEREGYDLQSLMNKDDTRVFMTDEYLYGIRARVNAGFGLWQLAFASKAPLTAANYAAARAAMARLRGDQGRLLGIKPTTLVVPYGLEESARNLITAATNDGGGSNPWTGTADLIVTPYLES